MRKLIFFLLFLLFSFAFTVWAESPYLKLSQSKNIFTNNLSSITIISKKSGSWNNPDTWENRQIPSPHSYVIIKHKVIIPINAQENCNSINIKSNGSLILENNSSLQLNNLLDISGNLNLNKSTSIYFNNPTQNIFLIQEKGNVRILGAEDSVLYANIISNDWPFQFIIKGFLGAKYLNIRNSQGINITKTAQIQELSYINLLKTKNTNYQIKSSISFKAQNINFDSELKTGVNIFLTDSRLRALLINCNKNNNLFDSSTSQIQWIKSNYENKAFEYNLAQYQNLEKINFTDLDNDFYPELIAFNNLKPKIYKNQNGKTFYEIFPFVKLNSQSLYKNFIICDYDFDQDQDIFLLTNTGKLELWKNQFIQTKQLNFNNSDFIQDLPSTPIINFLITNLNNDNLLDLILVTNKNIFFYVQNDEHFYTREISTQITNFNDIDLSKLKFIYQNDLDQNHQTDLIFQLDSKILILYQITTHNYLTQEFDIDNLDEMRNHLYFKDLNHDLYPEIILAQNKDFIIALENKNSSNPRSNKSFQKTKFYNSTIEQIINKIVLNPQSIIETDFNQDGQIDYFVTQYLKPIEVLQNFNDKYLSLKLQSKNQLLGTKVIIKTNQDIISKTIFDPSISTLFINLATANYIETLKIIFPNQKVYFKKNIQLSNINKIIASDQNYITNWLISGTLKDQNDNLISTGSIEIIDANTQNLISTHNVYHGRFNLKIKSNYKNIIIKAIAKINNSYQIKELPSMSLDQDIELNLIFSSSLNKVEGLITYQQNPIPNLYIKAINIHDSFQIETTQNYFITTTSKNGKFDLQLPNGNYLIQIYAGDNYLSSYSDYINIDSDKNIGNLDIDTLFDYSPPKIVITNLKKNQTINGIFHIQGSISDNLLLKNYILYYQNKDTDEWQSISTYNIEVNNSEIAIWNTQIISDGVYNFKIVAYDFVGLESIVEIKNIIISNVDPHIYQKTFYSGIQLISIPFKFTSLPELSLTNIQPGYAYWVNLDKNITINCKDRLFYYQSVKRNLKKGFSNIGNPFPYKIYIADLKFLYKNQIYSCEEAIQKKLIASTFWQWKLNKFYPITSFSTINPWQGISIYAYHNLALIFPDTAPLTKFSAFTTLASIKQNQKSSIDNWALKIILKKSGIIQGQENIIGVTPTSMDEFDINDAMTPPMPLFFESNPSISFSNMNWQKNPGDYSIDFKAPLDDKKSWNIKVTTPKATPLSPESLTIELSTLNNLPENYMVKLYDFDKKFWINILNNHNYNFIATSRETNFKLVVEDISKTLSNIDLQLTDLLVYPNPFNPNNESITIRYTLNKPAHGQLRIFSISGRLLKTFQISESDYGVLGVNFFVWNGLDEYNKFLPNDVYYYLFTLNDNFGFSVRKKGKIVIWKE